MTKENYEKEIRKALRANKTYEKGHDLLIKKTAQICVLFDMANEDVEKRGFTIINKNTKAQKQNKAVDATIHYGRIIPAYFDALGLSPKSNLGVSEDDRVQVMIKAHDSIKDD